MTLIINLLLLVIIVAKCAYFWFARHLPAPIFKGACIVIQIATLVVDLLFVHSVGVFILDALILGLYFFVPSVLIKGIYLLNLAFGILTTFARFFI